MKPTVGCIVHYTGIDGTGPEPLCGIIIGVTNEPNPDHRVALGMFGRHAYHVLDSVPYAQEPKPGHWNWPPPE